jgi:hypothetical protein
LRALALPNGTVIGLSAAPAGNGLVLVALGSATPAPG